MRFIVDIPVYVTGEVDAADADDAAFVMQSILADRTPRDLLYGNRIATRGGIVGNVRVVPLAPHQDATPDIYLCRGGKLVAIEQDGGVSLTGENCLVV